MDVYEVTKKLIGEIKPTGMSHVDNKRVENLDVHIKVVSRLVKDILECVWYTNRPEDSVKRIAKKAKSFFETFSSEFEI